MYIPSKWKNRTTVFSNSSGWSPAEVVKLSVDNDCFYLKSIDVKYSATTYSVKREKDVMQWLKGKLIIPKVIDFGCEDNREFLIMSELDGIYIDDIRTNPEEYIKHLVNVVNQLHSVDISSCPFDSGVDTRLSELGFLLSSGLASVNDWNETTPFADPNKFYQWLCDNKPQDEELVFSHGDLPANIFINGSNYRFNDLGRAGKADKWLDIAFCVKDIRYWYHNDKKYEDMFFELLNMQPNYEKIEYFILLDEMF
jgi:aminoglycoside phosphotransferase